MINQHAISSTLGQKNREFGTAPLIRTSESPINPRIPMDSRMKQITLIVGLTIVGYLKSLGQTGNETDYVPDEATALKIAEAVWLPIYGSGVLTKKPYVAELTQDIWHVHGTVESSGYVMNEKGDTVALRIVSGGVPHIKLKKSSGEVLEVFHSK